MPTATPVLPNVRELEQKKTVNGWIAVRVSCFYTLYEIFDQENIFLGPEGSKGMRSCIHFPERAQGHSGSK